MKKSNIIAITLITCMTAALITGCKKKYEEVDLSSHTTAAQTTAAATEAATTAAQTTAASSGEAKSDAVVTATIETYTQGDMKIQYPAVSGLSDTARQDELNKMLMDNAVSVIKGNDLGSDATVDITCKVITINKKQICVTYTGYYNEPGAAHPNNTFYTNTINIETLKNLGFSDYADPYTQAGYVLSSDVQLYNSNDDQLTDFKESRERYGLDYYKQLFEDADFPLKKDYFPECFSYAKDGYLYYSVPVSHAVGDYVLVKFSLEGK